MTKREFMENAPTLTVRAGPELDVEAYELMPKRNVQGGALGWVGTAKQMVDVGDETLDVRVRVVVVAEGSQHWPEGESTPEERETFHRHYGVSTWPPQPRT